MNLLSILNDSDDILSKLVDKCLCKVFVLFFHGPTELVIELLILVDFVSLLTLLTLFQMRDNWHRVCLTVQSILSP